MSQLSLFSADLTPPRREDLGGLLAAHGQLSRSADGVRLSILLADPWRAKALMREFRVRDVPAEVTTAGAELPANPEDGDNDADNDGHNDGHNDADNDADNDAGKGHEVAGGTLLRSERLAELDPLARAWTRGAVKAVPDDLSAEAGFLRCWTLAAGRPDEAGFLLGLDARAPDTYERLASVLARAGVAGVLLGARGGRPGLRIVGHRRFARLVELIGSPPPEAPAGAFPRPEH